MHGSLVTQGAESPLPAGTCRVMGGEGSRERAKAGARRRNRSQRAGASC